MSTSNSNQSPILHLSITTDKSPYPYETRFPASMALVEFKVKLELIVGIYVQDMRMELRSEDGRFLAEIFGDDRTLAELGVRDRCTVHVRDASGAGAGLGSGNGGDEAATRYVLSDDKYDARKDSVRKWMQELGVKPVADTSQMPLPAHIAVSKRVVVRVADQPEKSGRVAYVGPVHFKPGTWVGVVYDDAVGKNDGSIDNQRYFNCEQGHGGFVVPKAVHPEGVEQTTASGI